MKTINSNALAKATARFGSEPINIIGIKWDGVNEIKYADRDLNAAGTDIPGTIISLSNLDEVTKLSGAGGSGSISIVLDDTDGSLKDIFNRFDLHKKPITIYQYFSGLAITEAFVLFNGEVNTPITWSEGARTLSFSVLSKLEHNEVGFAPEEGQFANVSRDLIGKVWPLAFGDVVHVPATKVLEKVVGTTYSGIGLPDYTLPYKYEHLIQRLAILENGFTYYKLGISYLNAIGTQAEELDASYVEQMLANGDYVAIQDIIASTYTTYRTIVERLGNISDRNDTGVELKVRNDFIQYIFREDILKQIHEDVTVYINDKDRDFQKLQQLIQQTYQIDLTKTSASSALATVTADGTLGSGEKQRLIDSVNHYIFIQVKLEPAKRVAKDLSNRLERAKRHKEVLNIDTENAEYVYRNIHAIYKKMVTLTINYHKTLREVQKLLIIANEQSQMPQKAVAVVNAEKFPQDQTIAVTIKGMAFNGVMHNGTFTANSFVPKYSNIAVGGRQSTELDAFWVADPTVNIKGCYCLKAFIIGPDDPDYDPFNPGDLLRFRIFHVRDQIGAKCFINLVELKESRPVKKANAKIPVLDDLPDAINDILDETHEHTINERERILEGSLEAYEKEEVHEIKKKLEKLKELVGTAQYDWEIDAVNATIFKNVDEYNSKISSVKFKRSAVDKEQEAISDSEFKTLLKLENLRLRLLDQDIIPDAIPNGTKLYYITGFDITQSIMAASEIMPPEWFRYTVDNQELVTTDTFIPVPGGGQIKANLLPDSTFWFAEPGSSIELLHAVDEKYVANILPSTVVSVHAFRTINGLRQLVSVPPAYFTLSGADASYPPLTCTTIYLKQKLSRFNEGWDDQPYLSMSSSVGSNTVDILTWIIQNNTPFAIDSTSFNLVRSQIDNFPSSFALFNKQDALKLMEDIAHQARLTIWVKDSVVYLKYLAVEDDAVDSVSIDDMLENSIEIMLSETEDIVTKYTADWKPNYAQSENSQLIFRFNVSKYGNNITEENFYIYNIQSLVEKAATFWLIRKSNSWKRLRFKTPLTKLHLETYDTITVDYPPLADIPIKCVVEKCDYDSSDSSITIECWTPLRAGEMVPYSHAWPGSVTVGTIYPPLIEVNGGFAGSQYGSVPKNLAYKIDPNQNIVDQLTLKPKDYGESFTSDNDFVKPPSPLGLLSTTNYIRINPGNYTLPQFAFDEDEKTVPTYIGFAERDPDWVVGRANYEDRNWSGSTNFIGTITDVQEIESDPELEIFNPSYIYTVERPDKVEVEVTDRGGTGKGFEIGEVISVTPNPVSGKFETNDKKSDTLMQEVKLVQVYDDYMLCETIAGDQIYVAKPYSLQRTPWDGETVSLNSVSVTLAYSDGGHRTATGSPGVESQVVVPDFVINEWIVVWATRTDYDDPNGDLIEWLDINSAARAWAKI